MVRLSTLAETRNPMRQEKFALIKPVMTFTDGRCVARIRWSPTARAFCANVASGVSTSCCTVIIRSASSSTTTTTYGSTPSVYSASNGSSCWIPAWVASVSRCPFSGFRSRTLRLKSAMLRAWLAWNSW